MGVVAGMVNKPEKEMVIEIVDETTQILNSASRFVTPIAKLERQSAFAMEPFAVLAEDPSRKDSMKVSKLA
jgi:hypothetical protein